MCVFLKLRPLVRVKHILKVEEVEEVVGLVREG